ncbi:MAG: N-acetylmuramoyl-L-alanine amidase family protein [Brevinemataceae bacterium]
MKKVYQYVFLLIFILNFPLAAQQAKESFVNPSSYSNQSPAPQLIKTENPELSISNHISDSQNTQQQNISSNKSSSKTIRKQSQSSENISTESELCINLMQKFIPIDAVVLDAGHGGKDGGGVANNIEEKRLTLTLVKNIHTLFRNRNKKIKVYVTRKNDQFISLEERVSKTARWSTDKNILFVSIHGNIAYNSKIEGLEIYTLSDKASDSDALATERIENAGFTFEDIRNTDSLYSILADLIRDSTRIQSEWLARYVYDDTLKQTKMFGRGLKRANFFVLKYNTVPSILVEVGYMSHPGEAVNLRDPQFQKKLSVGIYNGISRYILEYNKTKGFTK